jgi:hypothetical protein
VDNHEKPETVSYRRHFVKRYVEYEKRMFCWLQLPLAKVKEMEEMLDIDKGLGCRFTDSTTYEEMAEFHADQHPSFQDSVSTIKHGGSLSVRKPVGNKPLICFGQDECVFKQFAFTPKAWTAPDGQKSMIPKDEGLISAVKQEAHKKRKRKLQTTKGADAERALLIEKTFHREAALEQDNLEWTGENRLLSPEEIVRLDAADRLDNNNMD